MVDVTGESPVTPWDALLAEVRRSAYRTSWLDQRINEEASRERELAHEAEEEHRFAIASELRKWLVESRRERMHLARISKAAVDAGLTERYVRGIEVEARLIARVLERAVGVLELTMEQKRAVALELRAALEEVTVELHERYVADRAAITQK